MTSYDVVRMCKHKLREMGVTKPKIGHGGTLDPFAEGVLLILIGRSATKRMNELSNLPKTYIATAKLGASSDTLDCTGIISVQGSSDPAGQQVRKSVSQLASEIQLIIPKFIGAIEQAVPDYSAAKVDGKPRYEYARAGVTLVPKSKIVTVHQLKVELISDSQAQMTATVSSGTYIRQLSYDFFMTLSVESYLEKLVRTQIGDYATKDCMRVEEIATADWGKYLQ